jgi:hypothetical protein
MKNGQFVEKIGKRINVHGLFGNYYSEFKENSLLAQLFNSFYLIRRIIFTLTIFYVDNG